MAAMPITIHVGSVGLVTPVVCDRESERKEASIWLPELSEATVWNADPDAAMVLQSAVALVAWRRRR